MNIYKHRYKLVKGSIIVICALSILYLSARPGQMHFQLTGTGSQETKIDKEEDSFNHQAANSLLSDPISALSDEDFHNDANLYENENGTLHKEKDRGSTKQKTENGNSVSKQPLKDSVQNLSNPVYDSPYTYVCVDNLCQRQLKSKSNKSTSCSIHVCWLTCGNYGSLWPVPSNSKGLQGKNTIPFQLFNLHFSIVGKPSENTANFLNEAINITTNILQKMRPVHMAKSKKLVDNTIVEVVLNAASVDGVLFILNSVDESYSLKISSNKEKENNRVKVEITSKTYYGIRHGLETFTQLVAFDEINNYFQIVDEVKIDDRPKFKYRGVLIDTARNFIPIAVLKRIVDGMSYNKLNVLHWHFADNEAFSLFDGKFPEISQCAAYSRKKVYTKEDIIDFVRYARIRGVKIVPELNPVHARYIGDGEGEHSNNCLIKGRNGTNDYTADSISSYAMNYLGSLYKDLFEAFDNDIFHMGAAILDFNCPAEKSSAGENPLKINSENYSKLWLSFQEKLRQNVEESIEGHPTAIIDMIPGKLNVDTLTKLDPAVYVVHTEEHPENARVQEIFKKGFRLVIAQKGSLEQGFRKENPDNVYTLWQTIYDNKFASSGNSLEQIWGSEVNVWTKSTNAKTIEVKLWPRANALAENLWSSISRDKTVYSRLNNHNFRLLHRGIPLETLQPESCFLISGNCDDPHHKI